MTNGNAKPSRPWLQGNTGFFHLAMWAGAIICTILTVRDYVVHQDFVGGAHWGILLFVGLDLIVRYEQVTGEISRRLKG